MQAVCKALALFAALTLFFCDSSTAQQAGGIESMKLLTPDVGWAATRSHLFWTTDNGAHWKDITPKLKHKRQTVSSVFFLDASTGWVLLSCSDDRDPITDDACFEFALTSDAGESWSIVHPKIVDPAPHSVITEDGQGFSGTTYLDFADSQHGWAILKRSLHVQASSGEMLRTVDGGRTWTQMAKNTLPMADNFHFVTPKDGWIAGGGQPESDLYVTRDGGDSWSQVIVKPPAAIKVKIWPPDENGVWPDYWLPFFEGSAHGFLIGSYWVGSEPICALFSTADLGRSWKFERTLPNIDGVTAFLRDALLVVSTPPSMDKLTTTRLPLDGRAAAHATVTADLSDTPLGHHDLGGGGLTGHD